MSARLSQALADFRSLRSRVESDADEDLTVELSEELDCVQEELESAQRETESWEAIESSHVKLGVTYNIGSYRVDSSKKLITLMQAGKEVFRHLGLDRLEALEAAAKWCRAELAK